MIRSAGRELIDAVIVGAGMVGAATALALARAGLKVAVIERHPVSPPQPGEPVDLRVVAIAPHAQRLLSELGVWADIAAVRACAYQRMQVVDAAGGSSLSFAAADYGWPCLGHIVENRLVAGALWRAVERESGVRLLLGDELQSFETDSAGVRVRLASGGVLGARLLVAADGVNSRVRNELLIGVDGAPYGQSGLMAHIDLERPQPGLAWQRFLPSGPLAFLPLSDGRASIVWTLPTERANALVAEPVEQFEAQLQRASAGQFGRVRLAAERAAFPLRLQIAQRFVDQRVILVGDAAHVVHPLAGQGVNLGFEDISALLASVARARAAQRAPFGDSDLLRWGRERRSEATLAARAFDGLNRLYGVAEGPLVAARALGLRVIDHLPPVKRKLAERAAGIRAGAL
ncbi:MAG: UbiH/UbiF/VisC/COQ6 family ubiquinone biosynthesis hydroxylase [Rhodanobacteraceae bacterium]|nr:UbiH/UbiF/VisC/COQ6 family ubiquinone biosynthesis hydroxylase [Rhodanobacteraceae bacterium]